MICHKGQSSFLCLWIVTRMKIIGLKKIITSTRGYSHPPPRPPLLSKRICQKYKLLKRGVRSQLPSPPLMVHFTLSFFCNLILYKLNGFYTYSQWNILLLREVCGKSKWKFKMAFAMKGGGGLEGVSSATYLFWKMIFVKNHLESFPDCENVFCT